MNMKINQTEIGLATPAHIMSRLRQRRGLSPDDGSMDAELEALSPADKLREVIAAELGDVATAEKVAAWALDCGMMTALQRPERKTKPEDTSESKLSSLVKNLLGVGDAFSLGIMNGILRHGMDFDAAADHARDLVTKIAKSGSGDTYSIEVLSGMVDELYEAARTDKLTGLLMRAAFEKDYCRLQDGWNALVLIDCDHFKTVNDSLGHDAGDTVLKSVADVIKRTIRAIDVPCRWGGDEFVLLLTRTAAADAQVVAERLRHAAAAADLSGVTLSVGVTIAERDEPLATALRRADAAMYSAKRAGKNAVMFA